VDREEEERKLPAVADSWASPSEARNFAAIFAPSRAGDERFVQWVARMERRTLSPGWATEVERMLLETDIRSVLPSIQAPTLVLHSHADEVVKVEHGRYLAEHIPGARLVELPGADHAFWFHSEARAIGLREIRTLLRNLAPPAAFDRVLATVVFTDIVGSTRRAAELGDSAWSRVLDQHFRVARAELSRFRGREIKATGDGLLATFDGPTRALRFADALRKQSRALGLELRVGMHTGECAFKNGDVEGIAVHIASRIADRAGPGEVLVSSTVRDLSVGSGLLLTGRGTYALKGISDRWRLFVLEPESSGAPAGRPENGA
jgi:class 3 adenylate cyclase